MKKLIFTVAIVLSMFKSNAQTRDTAFVTPTMAIQDISHCMERAHDQYSAGYTVAGIGTIFATAPIWLTTSRDENLPIVVGYVGGFFALVGTIMMIDSHKWIGRAGRFQVNPNGVLYKF